MNLTTAQYEAVYEINLDYLMSLNGHGDVFGSFGNWLTISLVTKWKPRRFGCRVISICCTIFFLKYSNLWCKSTKKAIKISTFANKIC